MMSVLERHHRIPDNGQEFTRSDSRLVFPPSPTAHGVLDGSWWPRTRDPAAELPVLDLLGDPPDTSTVLALTCLAIAASPNPRAGLSTTCTGRSRRQSCDRGARSGSRPAGWETDGGRVRELT